MFSKIHRVTLPKQVSSIGNFIGKKKKFYITAEHTAQPAEHTKLSFSDLEMLSQYLIENLCCIVLLNLLFLFSFYLGFLPRTFTNRRIAGEGGGHFFNPSLPELAAGLKTGTFGFREQVANY